MPNETNQFNEPDQSSKARRYGSGKFASSRHGSGLETIDKCPHHSRRAMRPLREPIPIGAHAAQDWVWIRPDIGAVIKIWNDGTWVWEHLSGAIEKQGHGEDMNNQIINRDTMCHRIEFAAGLMAIALFASLVLYAFAAAPSAEPVQVIVLPEVRP